MLSSLVSPNYSQSRRLGLTHFVTLLLLCLFSILSHAASESKQTLRFIVLAQDVKAIHPVRKNSPTNVQIVGEAGIERVLHVSGSSNQIQETIQTIAYNLQQMAGGQSQGTVNFTPPITLRLLVPNSQCGPLIGKRGQRIKEIRETSGATITIPRETLNGSTERSVTLAGSPENLSVAIGEIYAVLEAFPARTNNVQYSPNYFFRTPQKGHFYNQWQ